MTLDRFSANTEAPDVSTAGWAEFRENIKAPESCPRVWSPCMTVLTSQPVFSCVCVCKCSCGLVMALPVQESMSQRVLSHSVVNSTSLEVRLPRARGGTPSRPRCPTLAVAYWNVGMPDATSFARDVEAAIRKVLVAIEPLMANSIDIFGWSVAHSTCVRKLDIGISTLPGDGLVWRASGGRHYC